MNKNSKTFFKKMKVKRKDFRRPPTDWTGRDGG